MRLTTRISLALTLIALLFFGGYGAILLQTEAADLHRASKRTVLLVGRALQTATVTALRDGQVADVDAEFARLHQIDPQLSAYLFAGQRVVVQSPQAPAPDADVLRLAAQVAAEGRAVYQANAPLQAAPWSLVDRQIHAEPLGIALPGAATPALVLVQQLDELERDLQQTRQGVLMAIVLFGAVVSLLTLWFGRRYLAQPLQELAKAMEQVRGGDLSSGVPPRPRDEIGEVVTAFNLMVADLREARTALDDAQQERLRDQKALQQADKLIAIGQLSAGLAHEIGSPLQVLAGRARSLGKRADEPQEVRRIADILVSQTERITRIVEQLMHFARRQPSRLAEVDVPACARQVCDLLEVEARRHNVALLLECGQQVPSIIGNADQVQQVLFNLISNALQATKQGGKVTVEVRGPEPSTLGPTVQLLVRDNGCGIPPEVVPRLFDPFFTTRSGEGGTGLGLPVVKSIVTEHRGAIRIDSMVAEGTVVAVDWPLGPPQ